MIYAYLRIFTHILYIFVSSCAKWIKNAFHEANGFQVPFALDWSTFSRWKVQAEASASVPDTEQVDDDVWLQRRLEQTRTNSQDDYL